MIFLFVRNRNYCNHCTSVCMILFCFNLFSSCVSYYLDWDVFYLCCLNQNCIQEEIKCRLKTRNWCYYSVQTPLSSRLLSKNLKIKIYKTIILPVVLYGCETWSVTLWEERRLRVFENKILRLIFVPRREENGEWRRLQNEEFHSLYRSPNIVRMIKSRRLRWAEHVARMAESRSA